MPAVSEEELQQLREKNESLREQIADARNQAAENEADRLREYEALQLRTENVRLEAELASATRQADPEASEAGAKNVLEAAMERLRAAEAQSEQPAGVPVDTNAENPPEGTTGATVAEKVEAPAKPAADKTTTTSPSVSSPTLSISSNGGNN